MSGSNLRFINTLIFSLLLVLGLTGVYGLYFPFPSFLFEIHRIAAWALVVLIPWKTVISLRSLSRGLDSRFDRSVVVVASLLASLAVIVIIAFGLMWKWNVGEYYLWIAGYGYTAISWHWGVALYLSPLFALHIWRRWPRPKKVDFSGRRQALKLMGIGGASIAGWGISELLARAFQEEDMIRRFTGSREEGSFTGLEFPVTNGPGQGRVKLDPETWRFHLTGAVDSPLTLTYDEALALSTSDVTATIDCTGGWCSTQVWQGIRLTDLLNQAEVREDALGIVLKGVSEYASHFTLAQAQEILLATRIGGYILNHQHGYPLRAVVPSRRGWHWVKWLTEIEVLAFS